MPDARLDLLEGRLDPDLLELVDHPARCVDVDGQRAGGDHELHGVGGAEAGVGEELLGLGSLLDGIAHTGELGHLRRGESPHARRLGQQRSAEGRGALAGPDQVGLAVERQIDGAAHAHVGVRGALEVHQHVVVDVAVGLEHHQLRGAALGVLRVRLVPAAARHVELAGLKRRDLRGAVADDHELDAVEIRPPLDEVVGILHVLDRLARLVLLELERPGADALVLELGERHVGGEDRRVSRGEHGQERRLRSLEPEDHGVGVGRLDGLDVLVPELARVHLELGLGVRSPAHGVEGVLHVLRREGLAVVPLDVLPEEEDEVAVIVLPRPLVGQLGDDRVDALLLLGGIVVHEVVEAGAGLLGGGDRRLLVDRKTRCRAERGGHEHTAVLRGLGRCAHHEQQQGGGNTHQGQQRPERAGTRHCDLRERYGWDARSGTCRSIA